MKDNVFIKVFENRHIAGADTQVVTPPISEIIDAGNFATAIVYGKVTGNSNLAVYIGTTMNPASATSWERCSAGTIDFNGYTEKTTIIKATDNTPIHRYLRYEVTGRVSGVWSGSLTLYILLKRQ